MVRQKMVQQNIYKTISIEVVENSHASLLIPSLSVLSVIRLGNTVPDQSTLILPSSLYQIILHRAGLGWATPFLIIQH